ncbi:MAG: glycosyltransferase family 4 protein [Actinobacteria bacterium]|nr:glycosyltransferase family 4 protein [Actinomycetota bacterium]
MTLEQCWHRVPGGTAGAAVELAAALLAREDVDPVGVAAAHRRPPASGAAMPRGLAVRQLPLPRPALYEAWHRARRPAVQRATGPVDVVHATGYAMPPRRGAPVVWSVHDLAWRREPSSFTARGRRFFEAALACAARDADLVLCSSEATRADAQAAGLAPGRLRVVPLGVRARPVTEADVADVRRRHALARPYVLAVGTIEPRKNHRTLIEAMVRLDRRDVDLVLAGPAGWGPSLASAAGRLGDRARLLGFVRDADLAALYRGAEVVAYPSTWEGFGLPVLEAMAQGAPVVTSKGTSTEEVAGGAAVLVDPLDADALAAAVTRVLDDPALAERLRAAGRARAAELTWERCAERTVAAYREVAG